MRNVVDCTFCGKEIEKGKGKIIVKKDGSFANICSMKCEKNMFKLKRRAHKLKWTAKGQGKGE